MKVSRLLIMITLLYTTSEMSHTVAQEVKYGWRVGANAGLSGYFGEYNSKGLFAHPGVNFSLTGGYIADARWEFATAISFSTVKGSVKGMEDEFSVVLPSHFNAATYQWNLKAEFNFFPFGIGETYKQLRLWTPYVAAGIGVVAAKPTNSSLAIAPEIPVAFGVKFKVRERLNVKLELEAAKTFSHNIDGVSNAYEIKRKWFKGTDWLTAVSIGMTYEFGERCPTCHYVE